MELADLEGVGLVVDIAEISDLAKMLFKLFFFTIEKICENVFFPGKQF